jgi:mono/diheme cytochrome c family protein
MKPKIVLGAVALLVVAAFAQAKDTRKLQAIGQGRALYLQHCASCHGPQARGVESGESGEAASIPDLTRIEERDGVFNPVHVAVHIEGRRDGMKEETEMPCWGVALREEWPRGRGAAALQVWKLTKYLSFIQETRPKAGLASNGGR